MKNYSLRTNHKTFPIHVSIDNVNSLKSCPGQESVTLLIKRRNTLRQKSLFRLLYKGNKRTLLFFILVCMTLLIIYANSDRVFRKPIFSIFLLQDKMHTGNKDENQLNNYESIKSSTISANLCLRTSHILVNSTLVADIGVQVFLSKYHIFVIYTKDNYHLHMKFELFVHSLLKHTNAQLHLHIITDKKSEVSVLSVLQSQVQQFHRTLEFTFYDVNVCSSKINDIIDTLSTYFSSSPNSYYSDSIFFLSLGLHRITEPYMDRAILLDCDIVFRSDVRLLFKEFERFLPHQLFGLAPELTPVYRHILYRYRIKNPKTNFGNPYHQMLVSKHSSGRKEKSLTPAYIRHGYPGLNSGVVLLNLKRIRHSKVYEQKLTKFEVHRLVTKYDFKGHLGDQDLFTLLGFEYPNLIYRLDCVWNRQLCTWWKDHGYSDIFDAYFHCEGVIQMYHGNCNTRIPE